MRVETVLSRLKRVSTQRFIPEIDGLRFVAIMPVLFLHLSTGFLRFNPAYDEKWHNYNHWFREILLTGDLGVKIFFVISGFILALPFAKHHLLGDRPILLRKYFFKRLTRLEPPYLITLTIFLFVHVYVTKTGGWSELLPNYWASFFYVHNFVFDKWSVINPVAWSLEVEVQFYILVPLLTRIFIIKNKAYRRGLLLILILTAPTLQAIAPLEQFRLSPSFLNMYQYFLSGFLLAELFLLKELKTKKIWDLIGVVALIGIFAMGYLKGFFHHLIAPFILLFFISVFSGVTIKKVFSNIWLTTIGGMCYITYLIHYPLIHFLMKYTAHWGWGQSFTQDFLLQALIMIPVILIICALAFAVLERPFMYSDWPQRVRKIFGGRSGSSQSTDHGAR